VRPELLDRLLLLDPFSIELPDPEVMLCIAAPELGVPPQPAPRIALAHLGQCGHELLVEEQE
jgi:hypothetical protein